MAERRMFAKSIVLSDAFLDMPLSARCLYFTLGMLADDDGFVGNPKSIMRQCGASQDDMSVLLQKRYILGFESGIIVIKHWRMNNYLQNDRHKRTTYIEELSTLAIDDRGAYTEASKTQALNTMYTECIQDVYEMDTPGSIGKDRKGKVNNNRAFSKPTVEEVRAYCEERHNSVDAETFVDFYESKGWLVGKNKMKDWKAAVRTWEKSRKESNVKAENNKKIHNYSEREYDFDALMQEVT